MITDFLKTAACSAFLLFAAGGYSQSVTELKRSVTVETGVRLAEAQNLLGMAYAEGKGVRRNVKKGIEWLEKSASNGNAEALFNLAVRYHYGDGVEADMEKALELYRESAARYHGEAAYVLGAGYYFGDILPQDLDKACGYLETAAFSRLTVSRGSALLLFAACQLFGYDTEKNLDKFLLLADRCVKYGCIDGYNLLGYLYETGGPVEKEIDRALWYYSKAAKAGSGFALLHMGMIYADGADGAGNIGNAVACFERGAELGEADAMRRLVELYGDEGSGYYNFDRAAYWQRQLAYLGAEEDVCSLLEMYGDKWDAETETMLYTMLLCNGNAGTLGTVARLLAEGRYFERDLRSAGTVIRWAVEADPENLGYRDTQGEIYLMRGKEMKARRVWESVIEKEPGFYESAGTMSRLNEYMTAGLGRP